MDREGESYLGSVPFEGVLHIAPEADQAMTPNTRKRFIVEPQVLNAALDAEDRRPPAPSPSTLTVPAGGLSPPPRPNSQRGRLPRPSPSPGEHWAIASLPNSPLTSPYSNSPDTPGNSEFNVRSPPRLSNILGPESLLFNSMRRQSLIEQEDVADAKAEEPLSAHHRWSPRAQAGEEIDSPNSSFQGSLPSSPEMSGMPISVDGSRPSRQNRYLSGLQKITKLGKARQPMTMVGADVGVRNARRMSDADVLDQQRRSSMKKTGGGSEDLSSRYRLGRMLDKGVKTAGDVVKPTGGVPSSPMSPVVKNVRDHGGGTFDGSGGQSPSATRGSAVATGSGSMSQAEVRGSPSNPSARVWLSHGRQASDMSSSTSLENSASLSPASVSESSHEPPSEPRISISSTIYPTSSNNPSFDIARYPASPMPATNSDRESFIDLASPTFSPIAADFSFNSRAPAHGFAYPEQSIPPTSVYNSESIYGKPPPRAPSPSNFSKPRLARLVPPADRPAKPPIPTDPKPDFSYRSRSGNRASPVQGRKHSPLTHFATDLDGSLPTFSASNALTPKERAERIRTTRKLAQVFGLPPGVSPVSQSPQEVDVLNGCMPIPGPLNLNLPGKRRHHKPTASMSDDVANSTPVYGPGGDVVWPPPDSTRYVHLAPRRHSAPLSPDGLSFIVGRDSDIISSLSRNPSSVIDVGSVHEASASETSSMLRSRRGRSGPGPGSPMSFIDLSDEEAGTDTISEALVETPKASQGRHPFASTASLDSVSSDQLAEEERRRKREKLAKLHRFLGSRVPTHLVLGPLDEGSSLPPPTFDAPDNAEADIRKVKMRRRRSSSAAEFSRKWSDDIDRLKEELNEREKAINVRRAVKMEKMFGVAPPQTLYHTRAPVASSPNIASVRQPSPSVKNSPRTPATPPFRFTTAGPSSKAKGKSKRPGTSDSAQPLIDDGSRDSALLDISQSSVYIHYRHSLNSLNDIIDRDDKESLAELHDYITGDHYKTGEQYDYQFAPTASASGANARSNTSGAANTITSPLFDELAVSTPTAKSERRRSLPSRVSIASFTSEISMIYAPTPTEGSFQQRRRRAAKLTHFFGVDYRDLMSEILDSIEKGLEEERGKGTLKPDEVKDLQQKLVSLKTKRNSLLR